MIKAKIGGDVLEKQSVSAEDKKGDSSFSLSLSLVTKDIFGVCYLLAYAFLFSVG